MNIRLFLSMAFLAIILAGCSTPKDITYMQNAETLPPEVLKATAKINDPVIMSGDLLQISVSATNPELVKFFNKTEMVATGSTNNSDNPMFYYLVDNKGNIDFPILGKIYVAGKTQSAVETEITNLIYPR